MGRHTGLLVVGLRMGLLVGWDCGIALREIALVGIASWVGIVVRGIAGAGLPRTQDCLNEGCTWDCVAWDCLAGGIGSLGIASLVRIAVSGGCVVGQDCGRWECWAQGCRGHRAAGRPVPVGLRGMGLRGMGLPGRRDCFHRDCVVGRDCGRWECGAQGCREHRTAGRPVPVGLRTM